jgi:chromosomal replication initiator protein
MPDPESKVLEDVLALIRKEHPTVSRRWFDELEALGFAEGTFCVRAESDLHRDYLRRSCLDALNDAVRSVTGQLIAIRLLGPNDTWIHEKPKAKIGGNPEIHVVPQPELPKPLVTHAASERSRLTTDDTLPIDPNYGFDQFVIGPNNRFAHAAALAVSDAPGHSYNPLFIHGGVGLGKTHLLQAICLKIKQKHPDYLIHYVSCDGFMTQFMNAVQMNRMAEFRHAYRDVDMLVVDDIHFLTHRERTQEEFFHTFNALYQSNKQIILSSDAPPDEIPNLEERLISRFTWGLVARIEKPGFETRMEILKRKADERNVSMPDAVAREISLHLDTNVRDLEGAISKLQLVAQVDNRKIDLDLARVALGDDFAVATTAAGADPTIDQIITAVTEFYQVKRTEVLGKRKHKSITLPRQIGMYLARENTRHSLEEIGAHFGGRDHTTVMHAVRSIKQKCRADDDLHASVNSLEVKIRSGKFKAIS